MRTLMRTFMLSISFLVLVLSCAQMAFANFPVAVGDKWACFSAEQGLGCLENDNKRDFLAVLKSDQKVLDIGVGDRAACVITQAGAEKRVLSCPRGKSPHFVKESANWGEPKKIAMGIGQHCGIFGNDVKCRGRLEYDQAYDEPFAIGVGYSFGCVLDKKGVHCFGKNDLGPINPPSSMAITAPSALAVGSFHACVIDQGQVKCWGYNGFGQLDIPEDVVDATSISAGVDHTCAVGKNGARCWGHRDQQRFIAHRENPILFVASGIRRICAVRSDRRLYCTKEASSDRSYLNPRSVNIHPLTVANVQFLTGTKGRQSALATLQQFIHRPDASLLRQLDIWELQDPEMDLAEQELFHLLALRPYFKYSGYSLLRNEFFSVYEGVLSTQIESIGLGRLMDFANGRSLKAYLRTAIRFLLISLNTVSGDTHPELLPKLEVAIGGLTETLVTAENLSQWKLTSLLKVQQEVAPAVEELNKLMLNDPLLHSRALSQQVVLEFILSI